VTPISVPAAQNARMYRFRVNNAVFNVVSESAKRHGRRTGTYLSSVCAKYIKDNPDPQRLYVYPDLERFCPSHNPTQKQAVNIISITLHNTDIEWFEAAMKEFNLTPAQVATNIVLLTMIN
jgi:hypothetical protein